MEIKEYENLKGPKKFDVFITSIYKDFNKLQFTIDILKDKVSELNNIYVCSPSGDFKKKGIISVKDNEVLPFDYNRLKIKNPNPKWQYQMFLKLFQDITETDYYLTIDSDVFLNKDLNFFEDRHPVWYVIRDQNHGPYFKFNKKFFNLEREYNHSFIADMNFMNKTIISGMLKDFGYTKESFLESCVEGIDETCYLGEPELYGNYVYKYYPGLYKIKKIKDCYIGKKSTHNEIVWSDKEIKDQIKKLQCEGNIDIMALHSWVG